MREEERNPDSIYLLDLVDGKRVEIARNIDVKFAEQRLFIYIV